MKGKRFILLIFLLWPWLIPAVIAQKQNEDNQLKKADKLFEAGKYAEAYPLYTHLLSMNKGNVDITFKYGATLLYGSDRKADAIPFLEKAGSNSTTDVRVLFFLGKAYQLNYEFNKAIKAYQDFKSKADSKVLSVFDVDQAIRQSENGKDLISNIKEVLVLEKKNVAADDFFRYYELDHLAGKVLIAPEEFQTSYDKKKGHIPIIYSAPLSNMVYFSSYGKNGETGKDIYFVTRTGSGLWSDPVKLPAPVNSKYNEDYPFFHSDGKTLYFCSDGHNSMGGYDIFRSVYNPSTGSYTTPENLDFAINTPDDDLFYIADSLNQIAYFASARSSKQNRLDVYKVKVNLVPSNMIIIKGNFISETEPLLKDATITIEDEQTKRQIAVLNTDDKGNYLIDFKSGGQYNFYVEAGKNGIIHSGRVEVPHLDYVAAFKQELIMIEDNGTERLMIKNYFDSPLDEELEALTAEVLKKRALLEVTPADQLAEKSLASNATETDASFENIYLAAGFIKTGTNEGVKEWADKSTVELKKVNEQYKSMAGIAFTESRAYDEKASQLILQADTKIRAYKYNKDPEKRVVLLKEAVKLRVEAEENLLNASAALLLANKFSESVQKRDVVIAEMEKSSKNINQAIENKNSAALQAEIANLQELNIDLKSFDRGLKKPTAYIENIKDVKVEKQQAQLGHAENLREEKNATLALIRRLETQLNNAEEKDKSSVSIQLASAQSNLEIVEKDNELAWENYRNNDEEANVAIKGLEFASEWEGNTGEPMPEMESINRVIAHVNTQEKALNQITETEDAALLALGISAEEILTIEPAVLSTSIATNMANDKSPKSETALETTSETTVAEENIADEKPETSIASELLDGYDDKLSMAQSNSNEIDRLQETILLKQQLLEQVNQEIDAVETTFDKTDLALLQSDLVQEIALLNVSFELALKNQQTNFLAIEYYIPEYQQKINEIDASGLTNLEKSEAKTDYLNFVYEQLGALLDSISIIAVEEGDVFALRNKKENENSLRSLMTNTEADLFQLKQEMNQQSEIVIAVPENNELVDQAYPAYADKKILIDNNTALSEDEKATRLIQLNESLMAKIDMQIANLTDQKSKAAFDSFPLIDAKIAAYNSIKEEKQLEISEAITLLASQSSLSEEDDKMATTQEVVVEPIVLSTEEKSKMIASIDPGFETTYSLLMSSDKTQSQKLDEAVTMHESLSVSIDQKIFSLNQDVEMLSNNAETARIAEEIKNWESLSESINLEKENLTNQLVAVTVTEQRVSDTVIADELEQSDLNAEETVIADDVVANPESWGALLLSAKTNAALDLWINEGEISTDPGIESKVIKTKANEQSQSILELNQLVEQQKEIDNKLTNADKKETKKLQKEKEQLKSEAEEKEIELLTDRVPLLINEANIRLVDNNIDIKNKSAAKSLIQKTEAYLLQAKSAEGENKVEFLRQAYQLGLMALHQAGLTELSAQLAQEAGVESFYSIADESARSYDDKIQFYSKNIEILTKLEGENQEIINGKKENGVDENDAILKDQIETSKVYRDAIVWNRLKLDELNTLHAEIEQNAIREAEELNIPDSDDEFNSAMLALGLQEAQIAYVKDKPQLQTYYAMTWKEKALNKRINELQSQRATYISNAQVLLQNAEESDALKLDELSGKEVIAAYESQKKYNTDAIVWYEKVDSLDMLISVLDSQKNVVVTNRIAYQKNMDEDNLKAINDIESGLALDAITSAPDQEIVSEQQPEDTNVEEPESNNAETVATIEPPDNLQPEIDDEAPARTNAESDNEAPAQTNAETDNDSGETGLAEIPVTGFIFELGTSFYSSEDPIPVDPPLPTGVIFKVQIGAFRNRIPVEHFTGLTPLTAEKLDNGITRYTVGIFYDMPTAQMARAQVRSVGYDDAFIVAFLNGERIPINRALSLLDGDLQEVTFNEDSKNQSQSGDGTLNNNEVIVNKTATESAGQESGNSDNRAVLDQNSATTTDVDGTENPELKVGYYNVPNAAPATEVESIAKMFYTVQVGVYSKPVSLGEIYNIQPLNVERTGLGYTRYTSGQFSDILDAEEHKTYVIDQGIADAFITAYYQGKRISVEKAQTIMLTEPDATSDRQTAQFSISEPLKELDSDTVNNSPNLISSTNPLKREEIIRNADAGDLRYVIYLGTYQDNIPNEVATALLEYSDAGIKRAINQGKIIYSTREMRSMYEAEEWLGRFREANVDEARIIYVVSGEEITLKQAKEILDK